MDRKVLFIVAYGSEDFITDHFNFLNGFSILLPYGSL
jgi:hypothetical protein